MINAVKLSGIELFTLLYWVKGFEKSHLAVNPGSQLHLSWALVYGFILNLFTIRGGLERWLQRLKSTSVRQTSGFLWVGLFLLLG